MTAKPALAMAAACVLLGGVLTRAWTQDAAPALEAKKDEDALQTRSQVLRAVYLRLAAPLDEALEREKRSREVASERNMQMFQAENDYKQAKWARGFAERRLTEYVEVTSKDEADNSLIKIASAENSLQRSEESVAHSKLALELIRAALDAKGKDLTASDLASWFIVERAYEADRRKMEQDKIALERAQDKHRKLNAESFRSLEEAGRQIEVDQKKVEEAYCDVKLLLAKRVEENAKRDEASSSLSPTERKLLALLAEAARPGGVDPPTPQQPAEFKAYLDNLEAKLAEAPPLVEQIKEERLGNRFTQLGKRILDRAAEPAK